MKRIKLHSTREGNVFQTVGDGNNKQCRQCLKTDKEGNNVGEGIGFKCEKCEHKHEALFGFGFTYYGFFSTAPSANKPYYLPLIKDEKVLAEIDHIFETKVNILEDERAHDLLGMRRRGCAPYYCQKCRLMKDMYYFRLNFTGGSYEPAYTCEECGSELFLIDYEEDSSVPGLYTIVSDKGPIDWHCPKCGHDKVIWSSYIDWD